VSAGMAFAIAIVALVVVGALIAGALFSGTQEQRVAEERAPGPGVVRRRGGGRVRRHPGLEQPHYQGE